MIAPVSDIGQAVEGLLGQDVPFDKIVVVEEHPDYPGNLVIQNQYPQDLYEANHRWVSRHLILNEIFQMEAFVEDLESQGYAVLFGPSTKGVIDDHRRWSG